MWAHNSPDTLAEFEAVEDLVNWIDLAIRMTWIQQEVGTFDYRCDA